ncbi:altered inheritance of mitochondria protein 9, mitochondrial [Parachaetomium inaequale]|uniref:Altered inheritance of mitochondria protein 9, mitochondrial n=1 Tax=Parachaetomium inaequale TaxID=2588326 RepID=A0AAN6SMQ3_9PEZI|nr:altered inheritance of mitochondria protein 9, mitochondrial [Parachaetomium inaequale]
MASTPRDGLKWDTNRIYPTPCWAREPQLDAIAQVAREALALGHEDRCQVTFYAEGCFNKVYMVETSRGRSLMRVALPVDPGYKTRGEVTTLRWIRRMTHVPVPKVIAFDDTQNNAIGFEWILMELMPGVSAYKRWRKMTMADKIWFTEQVAEFQSQLFRHSLEDAKFQSIGTLSSADQGSEPTHGNPKPGRIVANMFFMENHFNYDVPRGPFRSSHDWLSACLALMRQEATETLENDDDEDNREDAEDLLHLATGLTTLLPNIFPRLQDPPERTALWHDDLSVWNILVDDDGKITAIIDWESASCKPLWVVAEMPEFLTDPTREEEPIRDEYGDDSNNTEEDDDLDDEGKTDLYWIHLMEYDQTQLRKIYTAKMKELWPQWEIEATHGSLKSDFHRAVRMCDSGWFNGQVEDWIDDMEEGTYPRLRDVLHPNNSNSN